MKGIADTGFLVAFFNRRDAYHQWAVGLAELISEPLLTCQAVLAESAYHLRSSDVVLKAVKTGLVRDAFDFTAHFARLCQLAVTYQDRGPDLADLCLICLSETHTTLPIITVDSDFKVYRRFGRQVIPTSMPK